MKQLFPTLTLFAAALAFAGEAEIRESLAAIDQQVGIQAVNPVEGAPFFEVVLGSGERLYTTENGEHFVSGDLYAVQSTGFENLTELGRGRERLELLAEFSESSTVIFSPEGPVKTRVNVFTDIDCGYCRKLHAEIEDYLAEGIEVRYFAFPRAGVGSESYNKYVSAFCAEDEQLRLTQAKAGQAIPTATCENPVADQYALGNRLGVRGTPSIIDSEGRMIPGYVPASELAVRLGL